MDNLEEKIREILEEELSSSLSDSTSKPSTVGSKGHNGIFSNVDDAIAAAKAAWEDYVDQPIEMRNKVVEAIKEGFRPHIEWMAKQIKEETGMGTVDAKIAK